LGRFYLDEDIGPALGTALQGEGHDVTAAVAEGRRSAKDDEHLLLAAQTQRIFVTHNRADFELLHDAWVHWSAAWGVEQAHAGILIIPQPRKVPVSRIVRDITRFLSSGATLENEMYRRLVGGSRATWERWRIGGGWSGI
jgi:hypothetical protein